MKLPTPESIQFAKESAQRIGKIEITTKPKFYFDVESKSSNSIDESFVQSLEKGEHLTDEYRAQHIASINV